MEKRDVEQLLEKDEMEGGTSFSINRKCSDSALLSDW